MLEAHKQLEAFMSQTDDGRPTDIHGQRDRELRVMDKAIRAGALPHRDGRTPETWEASGLWTSGLYGHTPPEGPSPFAQAELFDEWEKVVYARPFQADDDAGAHHPDDEPDDDDAEGPEDVASFVNEAWASFRDQFGDHDAAAVEQAVERLAAAGMIPEDVTASELASMAGRQLGLSRRPARQTARTRPTADDGDGRAAGISATTRGARGGGRGAPAEADPNAFVADLRDEQRRLGII